MLIWRKHLDISLVASGKTLAPRNSFFLPFPIRLFRYASKKAAGRKKREVRSRQKELIRPVVLIKLRGVILRVAILHGNPTRQDGGYVVAHDVTLLLFLLLLNPAQLKALTYG